MKWTPEDRERTEAELAIRRAEREKIVEQV
jgi:hypothetical protein